MRFPELHPDASDRAPSALDLKADTLATIPQLREKLQKFIGPVSFAPKYHYELLFNEVREIAFTPPPPSDRVHEPLISSFALIKIRRNLIILI